MVNLRDLESPEGVDVHTAAIKIAKKRTEEMISQAELNERK